MSDARPILGETADRLREEFDRSFARPAETVIRDRLDLIALKIGSERLAIRLRDIAGLHSGIKITPCPSPIAEFRGIAGLRTSLVPVYDLPQLLGAVPSSGRWMVLAAGTPVAFTFDDFLGHFRVLADGIAGSSSQTKQHVHEIARNDQGAWPVIDIPSVVAAIRTRVAAITSRKEQ